MDCYVIFLWFILIHHDAVVSSTRKQNSSHIPDESSKMEQVEQKENNTLTIRGKIIFRGGAPDSIPDGSTLTVKFQDTSMMDAPAVRLGEDVQKVNGYRNGDTLSYEIKTSNRPNFPSGTLSAVLNMGWTPTGDEWVRRGDWLNDTTHDVELSDDTNEYDEKDVEVMHYS